MKFKFSELKSIFHFKRADIKDDLAEIWQDVKIRIFILSALFINLINWLISIFINIQMKEEIIALHYNIYFGISLIGDSKQVYLMPGLGLIIIIANLLFVYIIKREDNFFIYLFAAASVLVNVFLLLGAGAVMMINFR